MSVAERSAWIYGHNINTLNRSIDFVEESSLATQRLAEIETRDYTLGEFVDAIAKALNKAGTQEYTVTLDRLTQKITISAANNFNLLVTTGSTSAISAYPLIGFTSNKSGLNSYEADTISGKLYEPQFRLQRYIDFLDDQAANESKVNIATNGQTVEAVSFGQRQVMSCNIRYATNILNQRVIDNNPQGVEDLREFLVYATQKYKLEFLPDKTNRLFFYDCILETTPNSNDGTRFQLKELYSRGLANYFESGTLTFLRINY